MRTRPRQRVHLPTAAYWHAATKDPQPTALPAPSPRDPPAMPPRDGSQPPSGKKCHAPPLLSWRLFRRQHLCPPSAKSTNPQLAPLALQDRPPIEPRRTAAPHPVRI